MCGKNVDNLMHFVDNYDCLCGKIVNNFAQNVGNYFLKSILMEYFLLELSTNSNKLFFKISKHHAFFRPIYTSFLSLFTSPFLIY